MTNKEILAKMQDTINVKCQLDFYLLPKKVSECEIKKALLFTMT